MEARVVPRKGFTQGFTCISADFTPAVTLTGAKVTTTPGLRTPVSTRPPGTVPYHQLYRHPAGANASVCLLGELVAGCNPELQAGGPMGTAILTGDFPPLEPRWPVSTWLQDVVTVPARNWCKCYRVGAVANFLNVGTDFLNSFLVSLLAVGWLCGIHFNSSNECFTPRVQARRTRSRVCPLSEMPASNSPAPAATVRTAQSAWEAPGITCLMKSLSRGINDANTALAGLRFPQGDSEGDTTLTSSFQFVQDPGIPGSPSLSAASFSNFAVVLLSVRRTCRPDGQSW